MLHQRSRFQPQPKCSFEPVQCRPPSGDGHEATGIIAKPIPELPPVMTAIFSSVMSVEALSFPGRSAFGLAARLIPATRLPYVCVFEHQERIARRHCAARHGFEVWFWAFDRREARLEIKREGDVDRLVGGEDRSVSSTRRCPRRVRLACPSHLYPRKAAVTSGGAIGGVFPSSDPPSLQA